MGLAQRFERKLEAGVGNAFARVFGGHVVPQEMVAAIRTAMAESVTAEPGGQRLVANAYVLALSQADHAALTADSDAAAVIDMLRSTVNNEAADKRWHVYGELLIALQANPSLHDGQVRVHATIDPDAHADGARNPGAPLMSQDPGPRPQDPNQYYGQGGYPEAYDPRAYDPAYQQPGLPARPPAATYEARAYEPQRPAAAPVEPTSAWGTPARVNAVTLELRDGSGRTYQLREGDNVIGRGQDAQFRVPDTGVSRLHVSVHWADGVAHLSDLRSTNGTTVNNHPVTTWKLENGDVIRVGHSEVLVRFS